jgi:acyl-coenzyme A synthetase/AMP-(fatty) acid ligase
VEDAAAFGVRCAESGETVNLAVRLSSATTAIGEVAAEVLELARASLKRAEVPTSVIVVSEIPRESSGKLRRKTLEQAIGMWTILVKTGLN